MPLKQQFWQVLPNKALNPKVGTCHAVKMNKVYLSSLLAANTNGSWKLQPFIIGKSGLPLSLTFSMSAVFIGDTHCVLFFS